MSTNADNEICGNYGLAEFDGKAVAALEAQQRESQPLISPELSITKLKGTSFPRQALESLRDSELPEEKRVELVTYLLGTWYRQQCDGQWTWVEDPSAHTGIFQSFGMGIKVGGAHFNAAVAARGIVAGDSLESLESQLLPLTKLAGEGNL